MARETGGIDPALLAELDLETQYADASRRRKYMGKVAMDKGQSWLIRFIPYPMAEGTKTWLGRYAQHWLNKKPIFCRQKSGPYFGGDANYNCPICALAEKGLAAQNKIVIERAEEVFAEPRWLAFCIVWKKDLGRGPQAVPANEQFVAHAFHMYRPVFDQLVVTARRADVTDWRTGSDFWVSRTARGTMLEKQDAEAIAAEDRLQETIDQIWGTIIPPDIAMPTVEEETEFFHKAKDFIQSGAIREDAAAGRGASRGAAPSARGGGRESSSPARQDPQDFNEEELNQAPPVQRPTPTRTAAAPPVAARAEAPAPAPKPETMAPRVATPPPAASRPAPVASQPANEPSSRSRTARPAATDMDEEDGVAPESKDPAPPVEVELQVESTPPQTPPPTIAPTGSAPKTRLGANILSRLQQAPKV
jgi:hypothetical protein